MPQSFACCFHHLIFSTRGRVPLLKEEMRPRLFAYLGGVLRHKGSALVAAGGMTDHVHLLISLERQTSVAEAMRLIKTNGSRWIHETYPSLSGFAWQAGYGAFSVSSSHLGRVEAYLSRQAEHHRTRSFQEEFIAFLDRHGITYDEGHLWD